MVFTDTINKMKQPNQTFTLQGIPISYEEDELEKFIDFSLRNRISLEDQQLADEICINAVREVSKREDVDFYNVFGIIGSYINRFRKEKFIYPLVKGEGKLTQTQINQLYSEGRGNSDEF